MTESVFLIEESSLKSKMFNGFRCNRSALILCLINVIVIQCFITYNQYQKWQEIRDKLDSTVSESHDAVLISQTMQKMLKGCLRRIETEDDSKDKPTIYAITPTFARPVQKAELTRLAQTFLHVPNFHWIVIEDSIKKTSLVSNFLGESGLTYTHLNVPTPPNYKLGRNDPNWKKPRGVEQRNAALKWLRENLDDNDKGIVYFADDDNTYSIKLFREMERIKIVGVWPVGLVGGLMVERPICNKTTNKVVDFNAAWKPDRPFPLDMAGFAVNLRVILEKKDAWFSFEIQSGHQESEILRQMVTRDQLEPLADFCTKVYVWHTRTEPPQLNAEQFLIKKGKQSNADIEV